MKTSHVLASLFFGTLAAAAPVDRRALVTKTEVVVETVVVYTTIYDDEPVPEATTTPASSYYAVPEQSTTAEAKPVTTFTPTPTPAYTSSVEVKSSSIYVAPVVQESSSIYTPPVVVTPTPSPTPTPTPVPEVQTSAAPVSSAPAPAATSAAVQQKAEASASTTTGQTYSGDFTIYDNNGGFGACGTALHDGDMIVALAQPAWGASTYDVMTGAATNPWCGQKIQIQYNGKTAEATIMDLCPGCVGDDIDLSLAVWNKLGMVEKTRIQGTWSKIN